MAASSTLARWLGLAGSLFAALLPARAATLPDDRAEAMLHLYEGGGVTAAGPALLVRKSIADKVSLSGSLYVDAVSNASVDVVTTASPYRETRTEVGLRADWLTRDSLLSVGITKSREPDYDAGAFSVDLSQETFGGMTTVNLGFTRGSDDIGRKGDGWFDEATHWQYRVGITQIVSPKLLATLNVEAVSDSGFLGNAYRASRVFGAAVPERVPRTRSSRAVLLRGIYDLGHRDAVRGEYRYFWDTWDIRAHTVEAGYRRYVGQAWLAEGYARWYWQSAALFYSDNATAETTYVSRNRQLGSFSNVSLGAKLSMDWKSVPGRYDLKANLAYELLRPNYRDYTDLRTGERYSFVAHVLQLYVTATF